MGNGHFHMKYVSNLYDVILRTGRGNSEALRIRGNVRHGAWYDHCGGR